MVATGFGDGVIGVIGEGTLAHGKRRSTICRFGSPGAVPGTRIKCKLFIQGMILVNTGRGVGN